MNEVCLLPGPVTLSAAVQAAWHRPPLYHRSAEFMTLYAQVRARLASLAGCGDVALFAGSGTLANDVVAATIAAGTSPGRGLILENGEFGCRLVAQAARFGLMPRVLSWPWGRPWDIDAIAAAFDDEPAGSWVWGVHHESSTGILNDLPALMALARQRGQRVCVDAVSSIGGLPVDLSEVALASGTSGKALGSCSGIALVFANRHKLGPLDLSRVPTYFDLHAALDHTGPRFTFPSPPLQALAAALTDYATPAQARARYDHYQFLGCYVRRELRRLGFLPLTGEHHASPTITTFAPPDGTTSEAFVELCHGRGFLVGGQSRYLSERRLVQIATMGALERTDVAPFFDDLSPLLPAARTPRGLVNTAQRRIAAPVEAAGRCAIR